MKDRPDLPQYLRIADELRAKLRQMPLDARFDTEQSLTETYGVSRGTIRQALAVLEHEGLLSRSQGRGSFRAMPSESPYRLQLSSEFMQSVRSADANNGIRGLSITVTGATLDIAELLGIPRGAKVRRVTRVRTVDGVPFAYCVAHLRTDVVPAFFKRDYKSSLAKLVRDDLKVHIESQHCDIFAVAADETVAKELSIPVGTPVMKIMLLAFGRDHTPLLSDVIYYPSFKALHVEF